MKVGLIKSLMVVSLLALSLLIAIPVSGTIWRVDDDSTGGTNVTIDKLSTAVPPNVTVDKVSTVTVDGKEIKKHEGEVVRVLTKILSVGGWAGLRQASPEQCRGSRVR